MYEITKSPDACSSLLTIYPEKKPFLVVGNEVMAVPGMKITKVKLVCLGFECPACGGGTGEHTKGHPDSYRRQCQFAVMCYCGQCDISWTVADNDGNGLLVYWE